MNVASFLIVQWNYSKGSLKKLIFEDSDMCDVNCKQNMGNANMEVLIYDGKMTRTVEIDKCRLIDGYPLFRDMFLSVDSDTVNITAINSEVCARILVGTWNASGKNKGFSAWKGKLYCVHVLNYLGVYQSPNEFIDISIPEEGLPLLYEVLNQYDCCPEFCLSNIRLMEFLTKYLGCRDKSMVHKSIAGLVDHRYFASSWDEGHIVLKNSVTHCKCYLDLDLKECVSAITPTRNIFAFGNRSGIYVVSNKKVIKTIELTSGFRNILVAPTEDYIVFYDDEWLVVYDIENDKEMRYEMDMYIDYVSVSPDGSVVIVFCHSWYYKTTYISTVKQQIVKKDRSTVFSHPLFCHCSDRIVFVTPEERKIEIVDRKRYFDGDYCVLDKMKCDVWESSPINALSFDDRLVCAVGIMDIVVVDIVAKETVFMCDLNFGVEYVTFSDDGQSIMCLEFETCEWRIIMIKNNDDF